MTGRLLVCYANDSNHVSTTAEYLASIGRHSKFEVRYAHVTNAAELAFDLNDFDAIFQNSCVRLAFEGHASPDYLAKLKSFRGLKLLAVQDEYDRTDTVRRALREIGFHTVLTVVPPAMVERIYPPEMFPGTEFIPVLTGYVPEHLARRPKVVRRLCDRPIMIGYRGREIGARYGRLGFEKFEIGRRMREICAERDIPHDIEWSEDKRLYGNAWYDFIGSCRATLGSESGSNVFDFDGSIEAKHAELAAARGGPVPYEEFRVYTDPVEAAYDMGQISPRIFEAAALRTPMILFTGRYSGMIEPNEHYIELKKDFSNVDEVLARLDDVDGLERLAARAYQRLVTSGAFSYRRFVALIDETISRQAAAHGTALRPASGRIAPAELGVDFPTLASLSEQPTEAPRDPAVFRYKQIARLSSATADQSKEIARLNEVYAAEIARLNEVYPAQIGRLNAAISHLNEVYPAETARLNDVISHLNEVYPAEIARLNEALTQQYTALTEEHARVDRSYQDEIAQLSAESARIRQLFLVRLALRLRKLGKSLAGFTGSFLSEASARTRRFFL